MALGCLRDDATMTNDNSNHRRDRILSTCGGFLFSRKSVARGALHPFFAKMPHFPLNQIKLPLQQSPSRLVIFKILICTRCDILNVTYIQVWYTKIYNEILRYRNITPTNSGLLKYHTWYIWTFKIPHHIFSEHLSYHTNWLMTVRTPHLTLSNFLNIMPTNIIICYITPDNKNK